MRIIFGTTIKRKKKYPMPLEDEGIALLFAFQEHMQSSYEANTAAGPTYHNNCLPSILSRFYRFTLKHITCISCHESRIFVFKISTSTILYKAPMEDRLSEYFPMLPLLHSKIFLSLMRGRQFSKNWDTLNDKYTLICRQWFNE